MSSPGEKRQMEVLRISYKVLPRHKTSVQERSFIGPLSSRSFSVAALLGGRFSYSSFFLSPVEGSEASGAVSIGLTLLVLIGCLSSPLAGIFLILGDFPLLKFLKERVWQLKLFHCFCILQKRQQRIQRKVQKAGNKSCSVQS